MTQIPIIKGIYGDAIGNFRAAYPRNLEPIIGDNGIAEGYLRTAPGLTFLVNGPGQDRGAIMWNGVCYRAMGTRLVSVVGSGLTDLGDISGGSPTSMDYSFTLLATASAERLFYWDGAALTEVTDPDLGVVLDVIWIDGYFMTTDGENLVVTELSDPYAVNPLKYGSSEEDPDPIVALKKVRGEVYALNRYTIENFQNIGGTGFPFRRNSGGLVPKGCVGTHACAYFLETFAFVGSGRNEQLSVYLAGQGQALPMSTPEIDRRLAALSDAEQADIQMEAIIEEGEQRIYVHLPNETMVYSHQASKQAETPIWHFIAGGVGADQQYPAQHFALLNGRWLGGTQGGAVGYLDEAVETHFGAVAGWEFSTNFLYNSSKGAILKVAELVGLTGQAPFGSNPTCFMSMTLDGRNWGQERAISQGTFGETNKRIQWRPKLKFRNYAGLRFRGANTAIASWARLEAEFEALSV